MARYAVTAFQDPISTTYKSLAEIKASANIRPRVYDIIVGADDAPADNDLTYAVQRTTGTAGVGTSVTPEALDPADPSAEVTATEDLTVEPTLAGIPLLEPPVNQRATFRWVGIPGGELIIAAVANAGLAFMGKSTAYAGSAVLTLHWIE